MESAGRNLIALAALVALALPASAAGNSSAYTKLDLAKCIAEPVDPDDPLASGVWRCAGYQGIKVLVEDSDERMLVSYGEAAEDEPAASQTLGPFNYAGETIEWRLDAAGRPFATILRFHTGSEDSGRGSTLVVTRLGPPGQVCRVGYVDAVANPNANQLARGVADDVAPGFRCGVDNALDYGLGPEGEGGD